MNGEPRGFFRVAAGFSSYDVDFTSDHGDSPGKNIGGGCRFLPPGDLPGSGIESTCPALAGRFFNAEPPKKLG